MNNLTEKGLGNQSLSTTQYGPLLHNDTPVTMYYCEPQGNPDSILKDIDTGFGETGEAEIQPSKPLYKTPLYKENYFGELKSESEKELARNNLGVYSKKVIDRLVEGLDAAGNFVTKTDVLQMIDSSGFTKSVLKANVDYNIPQNLFKL